MGTRLSAAIRGLAPEGVTTVADLVGGQLDTTLAVLATGGRHAPIADPDVTAHGGIEVWARPDGREVARLGEFAAAGRLRVFVAQTFGLDQGPDAFALSRTGHVRGKLVITPHPV